MTPSPWVCYHSVGWHFEIQLECLGSVRLNSHETGAGWAWPCACLDSALLNRMIRGRLEMLALTHSLEARRKISVGDPCCECLSITTYSRPKSHRKRSSCVTDEFERFIVIPSTNFTVKIPCYRQGERPRYARVLFLVLQSWSASGRPRKRTRAKN
jgi:hypothetical protein